MADAVRYQDIFRSGENANCESGYLEPISCKDEWEDTEYIDIDTLRDSSPISSTDHAVNASKSEEQPVYHTTGKPDRNRNANTIKENEDKRPKQILDASAMKKLKVLCIVSLAIFIVITVITVALVYILVNKTLATERKSDELQAEIKQLKLQTLNASGSPHLLESRLQSLESRTGSKSGARDELQVEIEQLKLQTLKASDSSHLLESRLQSLESRTGDIEQLKRMASNVSSDNKNVKTKFEALESKFEDEMLEDVEQVKRTMTTLQYNTQDLESQVQILESRIPGKVAFCVRLDHALKNVRIGQIIDFGTVLLNEGSGYNPTTGHFIAPTSGVYQFSYFISHNTNPQSQKWARLRANGRVVNAAVADAFHKHQDVQGGNVGIVRLNAGERAWIESWHVYDAVFNAGFHFSTFSGVLIYK